MKKQIESILGKKTKIKIVQVSNKIIVPHREALSHVIF